MQQEAEALFTILDYYERAEINKGVKIYRIFKEEIQLLRKKDNVFTVQVPSENSSRTYQVKLNTDEETDECTCPAYDNNYYCKHATAAVFYLLIQYLDIAVNEIETRYSIKLQDAKSKPKPGNTAKNIDTRNPDGATWKTIKAEPEFLLPEISSLSHYYHSDYYIKRTVRIVEANEQLLLWKFSVTDNNKPYFPEITFNRHSTYQYRCTCRSGAILCKHVKASFESVLEKNPAFFLQYKDWSTEKERLLQPYGIRPGDLDARFFGFSINAWGRLILKEPSFIWKKGATEKFSQLKSLLAPQKSRPDLPKEAFINFELGWLLNLSSKLFSNGFELEPLKITDKGSKPAFTKLNLHQPDNHALLKSLPDDSYTFLTALSEPALKKWLLPHTHNFYISNLTQLGPKETDLLEDHYFSQLQELWPWLVTQPVYVLREGKFAVGNFHPAALSAAPVKPCFSVIQEGGFIIVQIILEKEGGYYPADAFSFHNGLLIETDGIFYLPAADDRKVFKEFEKGFIRLYESDKATLIREVIPYLQKKYSVQVPDTFKVERIELTPKPQLLLKEYKDQYLMLQPQFDYDGTVADYEPGAEDILQLGSDGTLQAIARKELFETAFFESLRLLHPAFERQTANDFFYLPFSEVMKNGWFLKTVPALQQQDIPVLGIKDLKKFKYNTATPKWEMKAGTGIDWFDLQIEISFGDQAVSLLEVRKAVLSGQNVVVLGDGTFGMLPEEWLQQYGMLLKMGDAQKNGTLRISKLHYTLIDELHGQIDDEKVLQEIEEKKQKLKGIGNIATVKPSKKIKAKHRPYQLSGFQWLQVLDEVGWGGCLADDMGLGKTLQAITFLQYLKEKYEGSTHLVVCPTSLIYNWEAELQKFAPKLNYHIYYGKDRDFSEEHFERYDLVLTSYGILRLDIEHLIRFSWHYVILDESQAIKNPDAQITKALQLVKSHNRLILSGTPVQNNTYDLYAQFNFINPGLLGSRDFFNTEFANPIDKSADAEKSSRLRRLVYPFLLRRTKEQVATDLPDKTESILWCNMPKDQQAVYDHYKEYYRKMLLQKIEEEGMAKAGMYVLEGLLRLRQICDSPQLLKAPDVKTVTSIKTQELLREIKENTGQHKLLVFSQFTEMLTLIREALEAGGFSYRYLDGSTPAAKRKEAVERFQTDPAAKVFLISLKAGGVGLNLTAADYVYLIDPWWNPAVEQQAIDRTHRIGQTQKIFAYKMICKGTVEEKILQLQSRKKQLANDLITEDTGFIKKLRKEDVAFLFS